ncbi:WD40/YVTN/BNR-like repeat-containing protein [Variovorax sp. HJSM1_2]|uniref:WD40/YVTN/BNR-like repeat-containing protein n=1 Tax=Variovorax sp. HJSM1_2 TaxID=3366263 RepID=UPI003BBF9631
MKQVDGMTRRMALLGAIGFGLAPAAHAAQPLARALGQPALKVARPTQAVLQAVARAGQRLVAVGERGLVVYSDDHGQSWQQAQVPVSCTLTALRFADAKRGWAVGNMGVVLKTEDAGATWLKMLDGQAAAELALQAAQAQREIGKSPDAAARASVLLEDAQRLVAEGADKPLLDLSLRADGSLLVVGAYGLAFASTDGGRSWQSQMHGLPNPEGLTYYGMAERRHESLLFGEQGLLLRATAPNETFAAQTPPANGSLFGAVVLREGPLLLLGLRGKLLRSAAVGEGWSVLQTPVEASLMAGSQLADGRVLLVGAAGQLLQSEDGGERFQPLALTQRFPFTGLQQAADGALVLVGMRGLLRLTPAELAAAAIPSSSPTARKPAI